MTLENIGAMFHKLFDSYQQGWKALLGEIGLEELVKISDVLVDKPDNHTPGFYFGKVQHNNLQCYKKLLVQVIFGDKELRGEFGIAMVEGKLVLNQLRCHRFLEEAARLRSELGTLLHFCTSGRYQGTEYTTSCIQNTINGNP